MKNRSLIDDYLKRAQIRLEVLEILHEKESWADVVRESQEIVELALKALLRGGNVEVPRIHDVGKIILENKELFPEEIQKNAKQMAKISKDLRRDRELSFYGSEDITPSEFYEKEDSVKAKKNAKWIVEIVIRNQTSR